MICQLLAILQTELSQMKIKLHKLTIGLKSRSMAQANVQAPCIIERGDDPLMS